jgi:hypothetical protein|tara:strand:+ start:588 stop:1355 length:768 start_codon:yes stop_codon:yes gene_type:complete
MSVAFTYTDKNQKRTIRTGKAYKATVNAAVAVGDLLAPANADTASTFKLADDSTRAKATAIAIESSTAAGEEISVADWAELQTQDTIGAAGAVTQVYFAASSDFLGAELYLGESGKPSSAIGTSGQQIGILTARNRILVNPSVYGNSQELSNIIADPGASGAIPVIKSGSVSIVSATTETRTVADPTFVGQTLNIGLKTDGGTVTMTSASPVNQTGNNTLAFADVGDHLMLVASEDGADIEWRIVANDGVGLTTA